LIDSPNKAGNKASGAKIQELLHAQILTEKNVRKFDLAA
jgi:hypothetical protein